MSSSMAPPPNSPAPYDSAQLTAFDLDAYASEYTGRARITRLVAIADLLTAQQVFSGSGGGQHAADHPSIVELKRQALGGVIPVIKGETMDVGLYLQVISKLGELNKSAGVGSNGGNGASTSSDTDKMDLDPPAPSSSLPTSSSFPGPSSLSKHVTSTLSSSGLPSSSTSSSNPATPREMTGIADDVWVREKRALGQKGKDGLEVQLKGYAVNLIKESIRLGHHALATHHRVCGDAQAALKSYSRSREFNSNPMNELESSMGIIEVALDEGSFAQTNPAIIKAEFALNRLSSSIKASAMGPDIPGNGGDIGGGGLPSAASQHAVTGAQERANQEKAKEADQNQVKMGIRLKVARGLGKLSQGGAGGWEAAAREFAGIEGKLGEWEARVISSSDIAIYTALTALATLSRSAIKVNFLDNVQMRVFVEYGNGVFVKELAESFVEAKYDVMLAVLHKNRLRLDIDPFLSNQVNKLIQAITHRAYTQYFAPFQNVQLSRMASAFGYTQHGQYAQLAEDLKWLIEKGRLDARLDAIDDVLYTVNIDPRKEVFANAFETGKNLEATTQKAMIRLKFLQAELFVESRKERDERIAKQNGKQKGSNHGLSQSGGEGEDELQVALAASIRKR